MVTTAQALAQFAQDYSKACENETGNLPQVTHDETWSSLCEAANPIDGQLIDWIITSQTMPYDFSAVESALEITFHNDIKAFYGSFYSGSLFATFKDDKENDIQCELLQVWNDEDIERLSTNIVGHILMQKKLKQSHTVFIGCLVNSDKMLCIDNETGAVVTEIPGNKDRTELAPSLSVFLGQLMPLVNPDKELEYEAPLEIKAGLMPRLKELMRSLFGK